MPQSSISIYSRNPFMRQFARACLRVPKAWSRWRASEAQYLETPPVLANSFPKSGTHLLDQIISALPMCRNYGAFLSSMTSSFAFRERTERSTAHFIQSIAPAEIVRAHLFCEEHLASSLQQKRVVHYWIYRDLRDVVVSEAHYLRSMNRWHRLHDHFRRQETIEDAISLAIRGLPDSSPLYYPDVASRFQRFQGWLKTPDVFVVRFEQLASAECRTVVRSMVEWYADRVDRDVNVAEVTSDALQRIDPARSHTFRRGRSGGWQQFFTDRLRDEFHEVASGLPDELVNEMTAVPCAAPCGT